MDFEELEFTPAESYEPTPIEPIKEIKTRQDEIAEKRLANLRPIKKGEVANPNGRPKGSKNKSTIARKWLQVMEKGTNDLTGEVEWLSQEDLITIAMIKRAKKGDVKAYKELMSTAFGDDKNVNHTGMIGLAHIVGMEVI